MEMAFTRQALFPFHKEISEISFLIARKGVCFFQTILFRENDGNSCVMCYFYMHKFEEYEIRVE